MNKYSTASNPKSAELFSMDDLLGTKYEWLEVYNKPPATVEVSSEIYTHLSDLYAPEPLPEGCKLQSIYGIKIKIDPSLKPGEWKFV